MTLLVVGFLLVALYVNPLRTYYATQREAQTKRAEVAELRHEHNALLRRQAVLRRAASIELEARGLGMVKRTERAFVVKNLPRD